MTVKLDIDKFGRVLIPKRLRDALDLRPGESVEAELESGVLHLKPISRTVEVVERRGRLILQAAGPITGDPVAEMREARMAEVLGEW